MAPFASSWQALVELALEALPGPPAKLTPQILEALPDPIVWLRLKRGVPECVRGAAGSGNICVIVQEPSAATAWVPRHALPLNLESEGTEEMYPGQDWCALKILSHDAQNEQISVGSQLSSLLGAAEVKCLLLSAHGVEILLIPESLLSTAAATLVSKGHAIVANTKLCSLAQEACKHAPGDVTLSKKVAGVFSLVQREEPPGTIIEEYTEGDGPLRLQASCGLFVELRIAEGRSIDRSESSFGGRCQTFKEQGNVACTQLRSLNFKPPSVEAHRFQVTIGEASIEVVGNDHDTEYRELWAKVGGDASVDEVVALELQSETPAPKTPRSGIWLFCGRRFARIVGLTRGTGIVAGTCCDSLATLASLRGEAEVDKELRKNYEAVFGIVEEPGVLRTQKSAWHPDASDRTFFHASDKSTGQISVTKDTVVHTLPGGLIQTWRIAEWTYNPFASPAGADASDEESQVPSQATSLAPDSSPEPAEEDEEVAADEASGGDDDAAGEGTDVEIASEVAEKEEEPSEEEVVKKKKKKKAKRKTAAEDTETEAKPKKKRKKVSLKANSDADRKERKEKEAEEDGSEVKPKRKKGTKNGTEDKGTRAKAKAKSTEKEKKTKGKGTDKEVRDKKEKKEKKDKKDKKVKKESKTKKEKKSKASKKSKVKVAEEEEEEEPAPSEEQPTPIEEADDDEEGEAGEASPSADEAEAQSADEDAAPEESEEAEPERSPTPVVKIKPRKRVKKAKEA
eukprot:TRINITY_DN3391_c0_g1_i1.p1 TRINITY_DN3391_c0_g1~~TRINITY_DN3391_c0_g1_i1.p1  ORF type:complete len:740 (+),score=245.57 TRINITY_DN3391_c0_g1_i1:103-2322(+)